MSTYLENHDTATKAENLCIRKVDTLQGRKITYSIIIKGTSKPRNQVAKSA